MNVPEDLLYTKDHEWLRRQGDSGDSGVVGITDFAQHQLGDVVFVELPAVGARLTQGQVFGAVESVKAVSDLFAPVSGEVTELNLDLSNHPEAINKDCYGAGWLLRVRLTNAAEVDKLLSPAAYMALPSAH